MRAEVITLHSVANYGTQLQALATQEKLKEYFDDVSFIDYRRPDTYGLQLMRTFSKGSWVRGAAILPTMFLWRMIFGRFQRKYLKLTPQKYLSTDDLENFSDDADYYVVGSDQVWNTGWNGGIIPAFYLSFIPSDKPKFSFSSSFGMSELPASEVTEVSEYLEKFDSLSVREPSAVKIVQNQLGIGNVTQLVDPVLSMPASFWRSKATGKAPSKKYILIYSLNRNSKLDAYAEKISKNTGFLLIRFCTRLDQVLKNGHSKVIPNILDFITLIDNAEYVLTDSFHATAFSMLLNTPPICIYPGEYSNRISEFLMLVGEEDRHVSSYDDFEILDRKIDFASVNKVLLNERSKVDDFLKAATQQK
jgi:hypothetical protein